tara:strand:- start:807 stop:1622 length:816 start_codon:yes stop_codon:yes gene_type:complete
MTGKVFDSTNDPMSDLTLKMTEELKPDDVEDVQDLEEEEPPKREVENIFLVRQSKTKQSVKPDVMEDPLPSLGIESITKDEEIPRIQGERGKDKKPRKKRVMTPAALEKLAKARAASLIKRKAKKEAKLAATEAARIKRAKSKRQARAATPVQNIKLPVSENIKIPFKRIQEPKQPVNVFDDFDNFCNFMDRYDERKKKKHSTSRQPHPNKRMPDRSRPRPPVTPVERIPVHRGGSRRTSSPPTGNFSPYSLLKRGNSQFGSGNNNFGGNW